jgi:uncharacterized membrane protein YhhN
MLLALYGVLALANVIGQGSVVELVTKPLLMPVLALWVWLHGRHKLIIAALLFSWAGDVALLNGDKQLWFIAGMVFFLGAHLCYITAFVRSGARPKASVVTLYAVVYVAALVWLWKPLGAMAIPMTVYGLALATMATLSASVSRIVGIGGALFFVSDMLIAVRVAGVVERTDVWVMLTYVLAQALIAVGFARYRRARDSRA